MSETTLCPDCGAEIPTGQPKGLCPRCALKEALELSNGESHLLQTEDGANTSPPQPATPVGQLPSLKYFGDYELLEEIARGGMGIVYRARQASLNRIVAVKLLLRGEYASEDFIKRFRIEASAAASLQHPNIVAIHEVGVHEGHHYFAMDLVDGPNLARLLRDGPLPAKRAAGYVKTIAEAIHYAHEKGILHRDLKPSNVLIDANDQPRVTDFGLAKHLSSDSQPTTDLTQLTLSGHVLGSPGYMPPEQAIGARGKISRRSDVYSLGAMLYHLLTGQPPFGGGSVGETLKQVETQEPVSLRLINAGVPVDLETICLKCLEKDPERRYRSARVLSEELARFISDEPIQARPPSKMYRFRKLAQRNKLVFAVAAALVAALIAGTIVSTWQAIRATRAEALAKRRVIEVAAERDEKDKARTEAEAISAFLTGVFQRPDPQRDGSTITVAEILDRATRKLDTDLASQPARRARLQSTLGKTYHALGLDRKAIPLLEKARDYYPTTPGREHSQTLDAMHNLAMSYYDAGRRDEAIKLQEEVLALRRKVDGLEHSDTLRAMFNLARSYAGTNRRMEALKLREEVLAVRRKVNGPDHPDTISAMNAVAISYNDAGRQDEALKLREQVLALYRKLRGPEQPDTTLDAMNNLALSYRDAGRRDEALKLQEEVLALRRKVNGPDHPDTIGAMMNLANSYKGAGRRNEALKLQEEVLALFVKVRGPEHASTLGAMQNLAYSYHDAGRRNEALKLREELLALRRKVLGPEHSNTLLTMNHLAISYQAADRWNEARNLWVEVLALSRKVNGSEHLATLNALNTLAWAYEVGQKYAEAEPLYREVRQSQTTHHSSTNDIVVSANSDLAGLLSDWAWSERDALDKSKAVERAREAERLLRDCLATRTKTLRSSSSRLADTRSRLGGALVAIALIDSTLMPEARLDQFTEAESLLLKAQETLQQYETVDPAYSREALKRLIRLYEAWGKPEKLSAWQQKLDSLNAGKPKSSPVTEE